MRLTIGNGFHRIIEEYGKYQVQMVRVQKNEFHVGVIEKRTGEIMISIVATTVGVARGALHKFRLYAKKWTASDKKRRLKKKKRLT